MPTGSHVLKAGLASKKLHHVDDKLWFICPLCRQTVGVIYKRPIKNNLIGCRICLDLKYRCRKYKGMIESEANKKPPLG